MEILENNLDKNTFQENQKEDIVSIPVIHEEVSVGKKVIETGKVRIVKKVNEENQLVNIPLTHEEIDVQKIPFNQYLDTMPEPVRYEGDTMIIPVLKEVSVIRILLVEEIHVTKKRIQTQDSQTITLRKEEVTIENILPNDNMEPQEKI